jgi:hypothetical protein
MSLLVCVMRAEFSSWPGRQLEAQLEQPVLLLGDALDQFDVAQVSTVR